MNIFAVVGLCGMVASLIGFAWLFITAPKADTEAPSSTTVKASGRGRVALGEVVSTADTLADVRDDSSLTVRDLRHDA